MIERTIYIKEFNKSNVVLIDYRAKRAEVELIKLGMQVVKTPPLDVAYDSVCGHPDMMFHRLDEASAVCSPESFDYFKEKIPSMNIICGVKKIGREYPFDIAYNVARVGRTALHKFSYTEPEILEYYNKNNIKLINVNQGYSKCSVCVVNDEAIITSDQGIYNSAKGELDVLLVKAGYVKLKNMPYGFIGGASGIIDGTLVFNGNIKEHSDYNNIKSFCANHHVNIYPLHDGDLEDIGSVIQLF